MKNKTYNKFLVGNPSHLELKERIKENELTYLIMDLPFECNYNCMKCYRKSNILTEDINLDLRKEKIREAKELEARVLCIAGEGEPLFHKKTTKELVEYANSLDIITILYTNASLLDKKTAQFLFEHNTTLITSVDSFNPDVYRELTGGGDIKRVKENLKVAREIYEKGIKKLNNRTIETRLGLISIVSNQNKNEIQQIKNWCGDEVFYICNYPVKKEMR
jgi:MoaA/NifB/PqqE/SkfB family radical SAM enzyme